MIDPLPSDIFKTGEVLNNTYEIQGVLGRGGTGEVYLAVNQVTGRTFAIKALNAQFSGNSDYVELMKREEEMRNIHNEAVVRYNECSRTDAGHVILVMDYIAGPSLADEMATRGMQAKELMIVGHRIATGLVAAHANGIVHRDLSPDNIILRDGQPEQAIIIDFGIAKDTAADARTIVGNEFAGKYEYAAPEQLEGKAEARSDLYALGATLLAAFRGEAPYLGTTPGEIVRRKASPLDTERVPEPLKSLVDHLTSPVIEDRPESAEAVTHQISGLLRPTSRKEERARKTKDKTKRMRVLPIIAVCIAAALAGGIYALWNIIADPGLDTIEPYTLTASLVAPNEGALSGYAGDDQSAQALVDAFVASTGAGIDRADVALGLGAPFEAWSTDVADLLSLLSGLQRWNLQITDLAADLIGLAPSLANKAQIDAELAAWTANTQINLNADLLAGPEELFSTDLDPELARLETCGPLVIDGDRFALGDTVPIEGNVADPANNDALIGALTPLIGSRTVQLNTKVLNKDLCTIRSVLPALSNASLSIWLGNGLDGQTNLTGVYTPGQNPLAEVLVPASLDDGYLWVMIVDNTGVVYHVLPHVSNVEQQLTKLGRVEGGLRRIRILHTVDEFRQDRSKLAMTVNQGDFGKSELIAILSREPLFDIRRPRDESIESARAALESTLEIHSGDLLAIASRVIEARN